MAFVTADQLPARADAVIIGGGIMGAATAHYLAEAGMTDVVLLERDELGSGSTCKAAGGLRCQFSDEANIQLGARSLETFRRFPELFDQEIDLQTTGYLFLISTPDDVERFEASVALQRELGQATQMITVDEAERLCPVMSTDGLVAAAFNPDDGHCTPEAAVAGFAKSARRRGVRMAQRCGADEILVEDAPAGSRSAGGAGRRVVGVRVGDRIIETSTVVCAAGVWSKEIAATAGIDLPVTPLRRQIMVSQPVGFDVSSLPFTIDFSTSYYFHPEGSGLLFGAPEETDHRDFDTRADPNWLAHLAGFIEHRTPALADVEICRGWAGLYEDTPDHNALIGSATSVDGFHYACGFSGHGFLQGPAVGEVMRDIVLDRPPTIDVSGLSADRFAGASVRAEHAIV